MKSILLDTHTLIWYIGGIKTLSKKARELIPKSKVFVSTVDLFEIGMLIQADKLPLEESFDEILQFIDINEFKILQLQRSHFREFLQLPLIHKDPFDRMLVGVAKYEEFTLVSKDDNVRKYPIETFW